MESLAAEDGLSRRATRLASAPGSSLTPMTASALAVAPPAMGLCAAGLGCAPVAPPRGRAD